MKKMEQCWTQRGIQNDNIQNALSYVCKTVRRSLNSTVHRHILAKTTDLNGTVLRQILLQHKYQQCYIQPGIPQVSECTTEHGRVSEGAVPAQIIEEQEPFLEKQNDEETLLSKSIQNADTLNKKPPSEHESKREEDGKAVNSVESFQRQKLIVEKILVRESSEYSSSSPLLHEDEEDCSFCSSKRTEKCIKSLAPYLIYLSNSLERGTQLLKLQCKGIRYFYYQMFNGLLANHIGILDLVIITGRNISCNRVLHSLKMTFDGLLKFGESDAANKKYNGHLEFSPGLNKHTQDLIRLNELKSSLQKENERSVENTLILLQIQCLTILLTPKYGREKLISQAKTFISETQCEIDDSGIKLGEKLFERNHWVNKYEDLYNKIMKQDSPDELSSEKLSKNSQSYNSPKSPHNEEFNQGATNPSRNKRSSSKQKSKTMNDKENCESKQNDKTKNSKETDDTDTGENAEASEEEDSSQEIWKRKRCPVQMMFDLVEQVISVQNYKLDHLIASTLPTNNNNQHNSTSLSLLPNLLRHQILGLDIALGANLNDTTKLFLIGIRDLSLALNYRLVDILRPAETSRMSHLYSSRLLKEARSKELKQILRKLEDDIKLAQELYSKHKEKRWKHLLLKLIHEALYIIRGKQEITENFLFHVDQLTKTANTIVTEIEIDQNGFQIPLHWDYCFESEEYQLFMSYATNINNIFFNII